VSENTDTGALVALSRMYSLKRWSNLADHILIALHVITDAFSTNQRNITNFHLALNNQKITSLEFYHIIT
jgi:hypothetical protein